MRHQHRSELVSRGSVWQNDRCILHEISRRIFKGGGMGGHCSTRSQFLHKDVCPNSSPSSPSRKNPSDEYKTVTYRKKHLPRRCRIGFLTFPDTQKFKNNKKMSKKTGKGQFGKKTGKGLAATVRLLHPILLIAVPKKGKPCCAPQSDF